MNTIPKFPRLFLALLCVLTLGVSPAAAQRPRRKTPPAVPVGTAQPAALAARSVVDKFAPAGWTRYEIGTPMRFSLILPGKPSESTERMQLTPGIAATVRNYMSLGASGLYGATYIDGLPAGVMNEELKRTFFESFVKGFAEEFQSQMSKTGTSAEVTMLEQRVASAADLAGYEQDFEFDRMTGRIRLVYHGSRAYAVMSLWSETMDDRERTTFFNSLRVNRKR